ncbi:MAG: ABC transporter permease, partial [Planctomycetota bacterium]
MPRIINWLLGLIILNPICLRLIGGGSKRSRHLLLRSGYLAIMIIVLLALLVESSGTESLQQLAAGGANAFATVAYIQLALICLLAPVFMAGAIAQEANPRTWDILLTTPLTSLQIVLGNLFGRLFFVLALLVSSLPLFAVTQLFGGVPGESIFISYAIAAVTSLVVGVIAITLSCTRQAGRRAVFLFYIGVVTYLALTWSLDLLLRQSDPLGLGRTTCATPLNPFLAQNVLFGAENYRAWGATELIGAGWFTRLWLGSPILAYCLLGSMLSVGLMAYSTLALRLIGTRVSGRAPLWQRILKLRTKGVGQRPSRTV